MVTQYIGADVDSKMTDLAIERNKKIVRRVSVPTSIVCLREVLGQIRGHKELAIEEGPMAHWLYRGLRDVVDRLVICDPRRNAWVENDGTVYLWPEEFQKKMQSPLVLRLIVLERKGKKMYLLTNLSAEQLSEKQAAVLYEMRWGVELFYRSMKQTLSHRKMLSHAPEQARAELSWTLVGLQLLGLLSVDQIIRRRKDPLSWSVAASLRVVRLAMADRKPRQSCRGGFLGALSRAVKDNYKRSSAKKARNWPHKKKEKPPGAPKLRKANHTKLKKAQTIKDTKMVA